MRTTDIKTIILSSSFYLTAGALRDNELHVTMSVEPPLIQLPPKTQKSKAGGSTRKKRAFLSEASSFEEEERLTVPEAGINVEQQGTEYDGNTSEYLDASQRLAQQRSSALRMAEWEDEERLLGSTTRSLSPAFAASSEQGLASDVSSRPGPSAIASTIPQSRPEELIRLQDEFSARRHEKNIRHSTKDWRPNVSDASTHLERTGQNHS